VIVCCLKTAIRRLKVVEVKVVISRECEGLSDDVLVLSFGYSLRKMVEFVLTCNEPAGSLTEEDIEVCIRYHNADTDLGGSKYDIQIRVLASEFVSRKGNLDERARLLKELVMKELPEGVRGYVWVILAPASFAEF
jgi:hypothetical protein